jgi:hypothetical protein
MDFAVMQVCFVRWVFAVLAPRGHLAVSRSLNLTLLAPRGPTAPHGMPMPNVPSGPLLFVIGTPNVAALHWRGRLQRNIEQRPATKHIHCD